MEANSERRIANSLIVPFKYRFASDSPLEGDGFEPSVPREDEPRKGAVDPLTPADSKAPHHDRPAARKADSNSSVARHRELRFSRQGAPERTPRFSPAF